MWFFHTYIGFYTALYLLIGLIFGRSQRSFFRENYILPLFSARLPQFFIRQCCMFQALCSKEKEIFSISSSCVLLPELVYMTIVTVPLYRVLFGINEWLELKEKYKYRLF